MAPFEIKDKKQLNIALIELQLKTFSAKTVRKFKKHSGCILETPYQNFVSKGY